MSGCAAPVGGASTVGVDLGAQAVIEGSVTTAAEGAAPVAGAYVRLLDGSGEFTAEVPTDAAGSFRFFARPGEWTLRTLAPRSEPVDTGVTARQGEISRVVIAV